MAYSSPLLEESLSRRLGSYGVKCSHVQRGRDLAMYVLKWLRSSVRSGSGRAKLCRAPPADEAIAIVSAPLKMCVLCYVPTRASHFT